MGAPHRGMPVLDIVQRTLPDDANGADQADGNQSRGDSPAPRRRGRPKAANKAKKAGRKLTIPPPIFLRLNLESLKTGRTMSEIATEALDRYLPRHRIATEPKPQSAAEA